MELSPRKRAILAAVTKAYIETGEPIGSKALTLMLKNAPSSATLRNEMSELCELGLLTQPHTSAGRLPTSRGFKIYVDSLMTPEKISDTVKSYIDRGLSELNQAPEKIPAAVGRILTDLTGLPVITCLFSGSSPTVRRIESLHIGRNSVLLLVITSDGRARNTVLRLGSEFTPALAEKFSETVKRRIKGKTVSELTMAYMQSIAAETGMNAFSLTPLFSAVFEMVKGIEASSVNLSDEAALYNICESEDAARRIISLVNAREPVLSILDGIDGKVGVIFGKDTGFKEIEAHTVVAAKFNGSDKYKGAIGIIGPNRMSYGQIIPSVEYIALRLTDIMTEAQKDMEE